jgi:hypothetical protein
MASRSFAALAFVVLSSVLSACRGDGQPAATAARTACDRVISLCQGNDGDRRACEQGFADMRPNVDPENAARAARCVAEARTCGEASGCMAGAAARAGASFLRDFTNGLTR